jgi:hypothetical protein
MGLRKGFADDVDSFVAFSLSVQNQRKSRVGRALENHLEVGFAANRIRYPMLQPRQFVVGGPPYFYLPGKNWMPPLNSLRWMPERATLSIGRPLSPGKRLSLAGPCTDAHLQHGLRSRRPRTASPWEKSQSLARTLAFACLSDSPTHLPAPVQ